MRRFVVVEGLIGVGKTSLSRLLAEAWGARLVLEPSEHNPFLEPFYRDPARFALPVQLFYLMSRYRQQTEIRQEDLFAEAVVSDYLFAKDRLFAEKTLSEEELELYDRFGGIFDGIAPVPDLVVWLQAPVDVLLERIARRQAPGEEAITAAYLEDLEARYQRLFGRWSACPVLPIDNTHLDYVGEEPALAEVRRRIEAALAARPTDPTAPGSSPDREAQPLLFGAGS